MCVGKKNSCGANSSRKKNQARAAIGKKIGQGLSTNQVLREKCILPITKINAQPEGEKKKIIRNCKLLNPPFSIKIMIRP